MMKTNKPFHPSWAGAISVAGAAASCLLMSACATEHATADELASSEAAVRAAGELGAKGTPQAALHLQIAKQHLEQAKSLNNKGDGAAAKALLEEAKADAELAVVLTREQTAELDAQQAQQRLAGVSRVGEQPKAQ